MKAKCKSCGAEIKNFPDYVEEFAEMLNFECLKCFKLPEFVPGEATRRLKEKHSFNPTLASADGKSKRARKDKASRDE